MKFKWESKSKACGGSFIGVMANCVTEKRIKEYSFEEWIDPYKIK